MTASAFTASEKLAAVERELRFRLRVYPDLVARGKMSQALADRQILIMEEIALDYREQAKSERLI